ncbi:hypothetical protein [Sulfurovum riftiae]|uniref:Outer membrane protein beta-barrel domain-containing protein n=1 Tax=Sulfurovum riftiae TaxID=1630136 RepID=A0A151CJJ3_9BACT|nr:hypothetical protein [Sulfurovum riftiae]KYJ87712.1 hypothetical protein AS592_11520 [Sulfurovum riftiae]
MKTINKIVLAAVASVSMLNAGGDIAPAENTVTEDVVKEWQNEFQLYGLAVWIQGDMTLGRLPSSDLDITPHDIFSNLKLGAMVHYEGHHTNGWGLWLDYAFMNLGFNIADTLFVQDTAGYYQGILEAFVKYRVPLEKGYIDYYGGIRWWHNDIDNSLTIGSTTIDRSRVIDWYDPVIGARWTHPLNEKWSTMLRGDVGGFSIGTASDFTAAVELGALYDINADWQLKFSFKSLWVDYEEGTLEQKDHFVYDTVNFGPIIGITYRF